MSLYIPRIIRPVTSLNHLDGERLRTACVTIVDDSIAESQAGAERRYRNDPEKLKEVNTQLERRGIAFELGMAETEDAELRQILQDDGLDSLLQQVTDRGMIRAYQMILERLRHDGLSDEVETFCEEARGRAFVRLNENIFPRMGADDRFADNSETILGLFDFESPVLLPRSIPPAQQLVQRFQAVSLSPENAVVTDLLVRLPAEYFKLVAYYGRPRSFADLRAFVDGYVEHYGQPHPHGGGHFDGPVERLVDVNWRDLDVLLSETGLKDARALGSILYNPGIRAYLQNQSPALNNLLYRKISYPSKLDFIESVAAVGRIIAGDVYNDPYNHQRQYVSIEKDSLENVACVGEYLQISEFEELTQLLRSDDLIRALRWIPNPNVKAILDAAQPRNAREILDLAEHPGLREHAREASFPPLVEMLHELGVDKKDTRKTAIKVFSMAYNRDMQGSCEELRNYLRHHSETVSISPEEMAACRSFVLSILDDSNYSPQNLAAVAVLMKDRPLTVSEIERLKDLRERVQGFVTPVLAKRYMALDEEAERLELLAGYRIRMQEVLGSHPVKIDDPELVAEIIYLAYRPAGTTIEGIKDHIVYGNVEDMSPHLDGLKIDENGYPFRFRQIERAQEAEFDTVGLNSVENRVFRKPTQLSEDLVKGALSEKKAFEGYEDMLFARVLMTPGDYRVLAYIEEYKEGKTYSDVFSGERLEALSEILRIIPEEPEFAEALKQVLTVNAGVLLAASAAVEQHAWHARKGSASADERALMALLQKLMLRFEGKYGGENATVLDKAEKVLLDSLHLDIAGKHPVQVLMDLRDEKWKILFGHGYSQEKVVEVFADLMRSTARKHLRIVTAEQKKVEAVLSGGTVEGRAYVSKNVGSFYAKAGAGLCTAFNHAMWREARHLHLNFAINQQIAGNVMLYLEPGRDYLVARGFNPRNDTLMDYDRRSITEEMVRIVEEIAWANGYEEVFITEQGYWHMLSNREGPAKEVLEIAGRNQKRAAAENPAQRMEITNARFHPTEMQDSLVCERLILLSRKPVMKN